MILKIAVDGKTYEVEVEVAPEPPPVLPTFLTQSSAATTAPPAGATSGEEVVDGSKACRSPVSGIVVKCNARNGQTIQNGDILFVLKPRKWKLKLPRPYPAK